MPVSVSKENSDYLFCKYGVYIPLQFDEELKSYASKNNLSSCKVIEHILGKAIKDIREDRYIQ